MVVMRKVMVVEAVEVVGESWNDLLSRVRSELLQLFEVQLLLVDYFFDQLALLLAVFELRLLV